MCEAEEPSVPLVACTSRTCTGYHICMMAGIKIVQATLLAVRSS